MEGQPSTQRVAPQKSKSIVSPISPLSSYKSIIIILCVGLLLWMLLQGGVKHGVKDILNKRDENTDKTQSTFDKTKDTIKTAYEKTTDSAKNTLQDVIDKVKMGGSNIKTMYDEKIGTIQDTAQENKEHMKDKLNHAKDDVIQTAKETIDNVKSTSQTTMDKAKETLAETQFNVKQMLDMTGLIEQAHWTLREFLSPHLKIEEQIPIKILSGAKAVVFLTVIKGGVGLAGAFGTGIVMARNDIGHWSGPCAIALVGVDIGLNIGIEKSDHIIILHDDAAVRTFSSKGQLKLGIDVSVATGPKGRDISAGVTVGNKGHTTLISYSMAKGAYVGLSFEGQIIVMRNDCNEAYYGKKVDAQKILDGSVKPPKNKHLAQIHKTIDEYTARNLVFPEHTTEL